MKNLRREKSARKVGAAVLAALLGMSAFPISAAAEAGETTEASAEATTAAEAGETTEASAEATTAAEAEGTTEASAEATTATDAAGKSTASGTEKAGRSAESSYVLASDPKNAGSPATEPPEVPDTTYTKVFHYSQDALFSGIYKTNSYYLNVEDYWETAYAYAQIEYSVSPLITEDVPASLTFFVNDTPVYSCRIAYQEGRSQVVYVPIPVDLLKAGYNSFSITGYVQLYDEDGCLDDFSGANWVEISGDSLIQMGYEIGDTRNRLSYYPFPLVSSTDETGGNCTVYVPEDADDEEIRAAALLRADLGNETTDEDDIGFAAFASLEDLSASGASAAKAASSKTTSSKASTADTAPGADSEAQNRVIVAKQSDLPEDVAANMPDTGADTGAGCLVYEYSDDIGNVLVLTAEKSEDLYEGASMLMDENRVTQEKQSYAFVKSGSADQIAQNSKLSDLIQDGETIKGITNKDGLEFAGPFRQEQSVSLPLSGGFVLGEGGKVSLNIRYSDNLDFTRSMVTVYWGSVPVASRKLTKEGAEGETFSFLMPADVIGTRADSITIAFDLEIQDMYCTKRSDQMPWAYVSGDSEFFLPAGSSSRYSLDTRPYPFEKLGQMNDTTLVIPDQMTDTEWELLGNVMSLYGAEIKPYGKFTVQRASEFKGGSGSGNVILLGTYQDNTAIQKLNDQLSFAYTSDGQAFASNDQLLLSDTYAGDIGVLQLIRSPYQDNCAILVVSGTGDDTLNNIRNFIRVNENVWKLTGDAFLIDSDQETKSFTFLSDEETKSVTLREAIIANRDAILFTLVSTAAMAVLLIAIILIILRYRRNRNQEKK